MEDEMFKTHCAESAESMRREFGGGEAGACGICDP